jgi:hypothetical protein
MHITESFSLSSGLKISKPYIYEKIFPIPSHNFILIDGSHSGENQYPLWMEVIYLLEEEASKIKGFGGVDETEIIFYGDLKSSSSRARIIPTKALADGQLAFLIQNSRAIVTANKFSAGIASSYDKKTLFLENKKNKISYSPICSPGRSRTIYSENFKEISPEHICEKLCDLLGWKNSPTIETLYAGKFFSDNLYLDIIPNSFISESFKSNMPSHIRYDLINAYSNNSLQFLYQNLKQKKSNLITNKPIPLEILGGLKENIDSIVYDITNGVDLEFTKKLITFTEKIVFLFNSTINNHHNLEDRKFALIDIPYLITVNNIEPIPLEIINNWDFLEYKSNKIVLSQGKLYSNVLNTDADFEITDPNSPSKINKLSKVKNKEEFWKEQGEFSFFFKERKLDNNTKRL